MNYQEPATEEIQQLKNIELWLRSHEDERGRLNNVLITTSHKIGITPRELAFYILLRMS